MTGQWLRVDRKRPCVVCGKPDWCTYTDDGVDCCMRVQSDRPAANGGWIHGEKISGINQAGAHCAHLKLRNHNESPTFNARLWWETARNVTTTDTLGEWSAGLGLGADLLDWMGGSTACGLLTFPMHDGAGDICGIRTREPGGAKRAITGSRAGLFLSTCRDDSLDVLVTEGPTDACAALALGWEPIGRPSCLGCELHVVDTLRRWGVERVTLCEDADGPGHTGAEKLVDALLASRISVRLVRPGGGYKDLREWYRARVTRAQVESQWSQQKWRQ